MIQQYRTVCYTRETPQTHQVSASGDRFRCFLENVDAEGGLPIAAMKALPGALQAVAANAMSFIF